MLQESEQSAPGLQFAVVHRDGSRDAPLPVCILRAFYLVGKPKLQAGRPSSRQVEPLLKGKGPLAARGAHTKDLVMATPTWSGTCGQVGVPQNNPLKID